MPELLTNRLNQSAVNDWLQHDAAASAIITLSLSDEPLSGVIYAGTAQEVWNKLHQCYQGTGKQTIVYLIRELFRNTLSDTTPMDSQLNDMLHKAHILTLLGLVLPDALIAIAMVISLPESYKVLNTVLMSTADTLSTSAIIAQILAEEKSRNNAESAVTLLANAQKATKSKKKNNEQKNKKCSYCRKKGHLKEEC